MPKIPVYEPQTAAPFAPGPEERGDILAHPAAVAGAGLSQTETNTGGLLRHLTAMDAEKTRQQQISDAYDLILNGNKQRAQLEQDLRSGTFDADGVQLTPPATSRDYLKKHSEGMESIGNNIANATSDLMVRDTFQRNWKRESGAAAIQAGHYQYAMFQGEQTAEVTQRMHDALKDVGMEQDPIEADRKADIFRTYLTSKSNVISGGAARAEIIRQTFDSAIWQDKARKDIRGGISSEDLATKYEGKVDPLVLDNLMVRNDANMARAQAAYKQSIKDWNESVQRVASRAISQGQLTEQFLEDFKNAFTGEQLQAYYEVYRQQQLGQHTLSKNAAIANYHMASVANRSSLRINPEEQLARLTTDFNNKQIGSDLFIPYSSMWNTEIERRRNDAKATNNQDATEERRLKEHAYRAGVADIETIFKPTEKFINFDATLTLQKNLMMQEYNKRVEWMGGTEDPQSVIREILPKYLIPTGERLNQYTGALKSQINYSSVQDLVAARGSIGETEYKRQLGLMKQVRDLQDAQQRYYSSPLRPKPPEMK